MGLNKAMHFNYCKPIPYDAAENCTVEFADTPGGFLTNWRINWKDGQVKTGFCEDGAAKVFYCEPEADLGDLNYRLVPGNLNDCRALKATWPIWEVTRDAEPEPDFPD